jgi:HEAT repeat protein
VCAGLAVLGCATPGYVKTAYYGNLPTLTQEIHSAAASGHMSKSDVLALAEAVARREVRSAQGDDAHRRILASRSCVSAVKPELEERADVRDDVGAEAMLVLVEAGVEGRGSLVDRYGKSDSGAWRAVAARGTGPSEYAAMRRSFYADPDERVRRESLRAGAEARDPADLVALLEAARLDPDVENRGLATRAVGAIGGERAVLGLKDLLADADTTGQIAVVDAWTVAGALAAGGRTELLALAESEASMASVAAAAALVRVGGAGSDEGAAALIRDVKEGTTEERIVAIELVPLGDPATVPALDAAATTDDPSVRVVALARLLEVPARRAASQAALETVARGNDSAARQARVALAVAVDPMSVPLLQAELSSAGPSARERAAIALFRLGKPAEMAIALADPDPSVRMAVACGVLNPS